MVLLLFYNYRAYCTVLSYFVYVFKSLFKGFKLATRVFGISMSGLFLNKGV